MTDLSIDRRALVVVVLVVDVFLVGFHVLSTWLAFHGEDAFGRSFGGAGLFDLDAEVSVPTWWQQSVLFVAAGLATLIAGLGSRAGLRDRRHWTALAVVLLVVSIDEGSEIHERLIHPMRDAFDITGGVFWFAWLIPGLAALAIFLATFARFWWRLPRLVRDRLALAGVLYLSGAVLFEMVGGWYESSNGVQDFGYSLVIAAEEGLEMLGAAALISALLVMVPTVAPAGFHVRPTPSAVSDAGVEARRTVP